MPPVTELNAQATVCCLIAAGVVLRRSDWLAADFWPAAERLTYYLLFPCLIVTTLARAPLEDTPWLRIAFALAVPMIGVAVVMTALRKRSRIDGPRWTSLLQGAVRMNTYIGLSISSSLYGDQGLATAAVAVAVIVPVVNGLCVTALARLGTNPKKAKPRVVSALVTNPLILASVVGVGLNTWGQGNPPVLGEVAEAFGRAALPLGLLSVGAALRIESLAQTGAAEAVVTGVKLVVLPTIVGLMLLALEVRGIDAAVPTIFAALPTAPSAYVLARVLGGDADAMASLVTLQTVLSTVTLPIVLVVTGP